MVNEYFYKILYFNKRKSENRTLNHRSLIVLYQLKCVTSLDSMDIIK